MMVFSAFWMYEEYTGVSYEEKKVLSYTQRGNYTYSAPVTEPNPLYPEGARLEMGKPAYFFTVSPTMDVSFKYKLEATSSADLNVEAKTMIVASDKEGYGGEQKGEEQNGEEQNGEEQNEEGQKIFWQKSYQVGDSKSAHLKNADVLTSNFTLDIPKIQAQTKEIQDQLNYSSNPTIEIVTAINYEGKINGKDVTNTQNFVIPVNISSTYYQMPEELGFIEDKYENIRAQKDTSLSAIKFPMFLFLLSTVLIGALIPIRKMKKIDKEYIKKLENESKNSSFKEFISKGKIPENRSSLLQIEISSLEDLVNAASDMNERVIYDVKSGEYFIIHNGVLYIFWDALSEKYQKTA